MIQSHRFPLLLTAFVLGAFCALPHAALAQASPLLGTNLIVNGGAEAGKAATDSTLVDIPGWTREGNFQVMAYGAGGCPSLTDPGPKDRGNNFFFGGPSNPASSASQTIDVSTLSSVLAKGTVTFSLSAYLGGYESQKDHTALLVSFRDRAGRTLLTVTLGPVTAAQRKGITGLLPVSKTGRVPAGTQTVVIFMKMVRTDGSDNDGSADNLSLVFKR
jgi:hypothetical protein